VDERIAALDRQVTIPRRLRESVRRPDGTLTGLAS
jgi:hypothetical protein